MRRSRWARATAAAVVLAALVAGSAYAITLRAGNIIANGEGGFAPTALPRDHDAPIKLFGHGRIRTIDGTRPSPLRKIVVELDKHGHAETRGLPKCTMSKLVATTTRQARKACPESIIGTGYGTAMIELPEQPRIEASSSITVFIAPERHGNPSGIGHAHLTYPLPTTYLVQGELKKVNNGRYGYRVEIDLPKIANDYGSGVYGRLKIERKWTYKGMRLSIANARCPDGRLQGRIELTFKDGTFLSGSAFKPCKMLP